MHGAGAEDILLAEVRYNAGEFNSATIAAHRARSTAQEYNQVCVEVCALFLLAKLHLQQGEYDQAMDYMHAMRELVEKKRHSPYCKQWICVWVFACQHPKAEKNSQMAASGQRRKLYAFARGSSNLVLGSVYYLPDNTLN